MLGLVFAQGAVTASAGSVAGTAGGAFATTAAPAASAGGSEAGAAGDVPAMPCHNGAHGAAVGPAGAAEALPAGNTCEVHCSDVATLAAAADLPPAVPSPALRIEPFAAARPPSADVTPLSARCASPPLRVAYVRFLI
jgi:hypothetical protein